MAPTFRFSTVKTEDRAIVLFLHTADAPDDPTWALSMQEVAAQIRAVGVERLAVLVITDGGAPSTTQRKALAEATQNGRHPLAVVNSNPVIRGVITAISWFNSGIKPFAPNKWRDAVAHCGCSDKAAVPLLDEMRRLQKELGKPVACLAAVTP